MYRLVVVIVLAGACRIGFDDVGLRASGTDDSAANTMPIDAAPGTLLPPLVADTYLQGIDTTLNGGDPDVRCGRASSNGNNLWALYRFDLTGVPQQAVSNATLRLYPYSSAGTLTITFEAWALTEPWDEATADWANASATASWTTPGGTIGAAPYAMIPITLGVSGYYDWDITTLVNEWLTGAQPNNGLELTYQSQPPTGNYVMFASKEHPTAAWHGQLLLTP